MHKTCSRCKTEKAIEDFRENKGKYRGECKECEREKNREYERNNREKRVERHAKWRDDNRDSINFRNRERWKNDPGFREKFQKYKGKYSEWVCQYISNYKKNNRKKCNCREQLRYHVKKGTIIKSDVCEICQQKSDRIEAHHADYDKPLEVRWFCKLCHLQFHRENSL